MNEVKTNSFKGLNRLPVIAEGEGAVFRGLSLKSYPAAENEGMRQTGALYIKSDGVDVPADGGKLQAVGDIVLRDGKYYLTGVYDGVFYFEGEAVEYYGNYGTEQKIRSEDRVEIVKAGTRYVILSVHQDGKSAVWEYNSLGTSIGTEEDKAKDGKLTTEVIAYKLPPSPINSLVLYKLAEEDNDVTRVGRIQGASGKDYYMLFFYKMYNGNKVSRNCSSAMKAFEVYNSYYGLRGSYILMKPSTDTELFNKEKYCFDDTESEHPVRFVIDAASLGTANGGDIDVYDYLFDAESELYDIETMGDRSTDMLEPYSMTTGSSRSYVPIFDSDGKLRSYNNSPVNEGSGIIGHFERWNTEHKRYEFYKGTDNNPIYQIMDKEGNPDYPTDEKIYFNTSGSNRRSYTAIGISYAGLINDSMTLSHIALMGNRIFATVKNGRQILCSATGKYTNFAEMTGAGSDSSFWDDSTEGEYTGLAAYSGTLLAFKENRISVYYGTPPNMTRSRDITGIGCIDCRSIKEVRGVLYFLAKDGFYAYSGGMPKRISRKLARVYKSAFAYEKEGCYIADAICEDGTREMVTYYPELDMWSEGEGIGILSEDGGLLISGDGAVLEYSRGGEWCYETGDIYEGIFEDKGINEIYIRGRINGSFKVTTISDDEEFEHSEISDDTMRLKVWRIPVRLKHKNHYRIRVEGRGLCVLYALERSSYIGGKKR